MIFPENIDSSYLLISRAGLCELQICNAAGGLWILPLKISANSSAPDDIITIESIGLDEIAQTSFHLTSTCQ